MLVLLPALLLILLGFVLLVVQRMRPNFGYAWLGASASTLIVWGLMLYLRFRLPSELVIENWRAFSALGSDSLVFQVDYISWPYALALSTLIAAVVISSPARLDAGGSLPSWDRGLMLVGMGLLAVFAASPLALVLMWTAIDVVELLALLGTATGDRLERSAVTSFAFRVTGTLLVLLAVLQGGPGATFDFISHSQHLSLLLVLGAGLRLGVLPLNVPYASEPVLRRGIGTLLRMVAAASSLVLLARLPENAVPAAWVPWLLILAVLAALYGAGRWATAKDALSGRPYWLVAMAALAIGCVAQGQPSASLAWGVAMILPGSVLFLFSARSAGLLALPALGLIGLLGLPFTPAAGGWVGLLGSPVNGNGLLFLVAQALLAIGYIRHALAPARPWSELETWARAVYPLGLALLIVADILIGIWGGPGFRTLGIWWAAVISTAFIGFLVIGSRLLRPAARVGWLVTLGQRVVNFLSKIISLTWFYRLLEWFYARLGQVVRFLSLIFEGDGGVLWTLVFLALLITLIRSQVTP